MKQNPYPIFFAVLVAHCGLHCSFVRGNYSCVQAQTTQTTTTTTPEQQESIEELLEFLARESSISPQLDEIETLMQCPLELRTASLQDLLHLPGFTVKTARLILSFARTTQLSSIHELSRALNLSQAQRAVLLLCTRLSGAPVPSSVTTNQAQLKKSAQSPQPAKPETKTDAGIPGTLLYRARYNRYLVPPKGLTNGAFLGDALGLYQRLTYRYAQHELNITAQKDVGERSLVDFLSGFVRTSFGERTDNASLRLIAGDFLVFAGMGNTLWSAFGARKSADAVAPAAQYAFSIEPYRSSTEQQFFRGAAAQGSVKLTSRSTLNAMLWASSFGRAASIDSALDVATSLDVDGYFRTASEISKRNTLQERSYGAGFEWRTQFDSLATNSTTTSNAHSSSINTSTAPILALGATAFLLEYSKPVTSRSVSVFAGERGVFAAAFASVSAGASFAAAELSRDGSGNIGGRFGLQTQSQLFEAAASFRTFPAAFRSPFGYNFGESSRPTNEQGLYLGFVWKGWQRLRAASYLDLYRSHEATSTVPVPLQGVDVLTEWQWEVNPALTLLARTSYERKTDALTVRTDSKTSQRVAFGRERATLRTELFWEPQEFHSTVRLRGRVEAVAIGFEQWKPMEFGGLAFAEIGWKPMESMKISARATLYRTASFESAIWQFEPHVAGVLANTALYGSGMRYLLLAAWQPAEWLGIWLRGDATVRNGVTSLGSGQLEISGNTDARLTAQVEVRL